MTTEMLSYVHQAQSVAAGALSSEMNLFFLKYIMLYSYQQLTKNVLNHVGPSKVIIFS